MTLNSQADDNDDDEFHVEHPTKSPQGGFEQASWIKRSHIPPFRKFSRTSLPAISVLKSLPLGCDEHRPFCIGTTS
uniref:Uncharacterized protein n=1 Tax=Vespula pensylvanica TaxID=30213 RepID=A0A834PGA4_VESPE|nr:hypothetical protein H0235_001498 [Vespula pensylvanica]